MFLGIGAPQFDVAPATGPHEQRDRQVALPVEEFLENVGEELVIKAAAALHKDASIRVVPAGSQKQLDVRVVFASSIVQPAIIHSLR